VVPTPEPTTETGVADEVLTEVVDATLLITLNRPSARNAVDRATAEGLAAAMDRLDEDPALQAAILTGAEGTFCAGMDLKAFVKGEAPVIEGRGFAGVTEAPPAKPLIAAVEGYALAGGCELALACDLIVAARGARFGIPEVKRGLVAAGGGLVRLPRRIPPAIAMELALTGDPIDAERAERLGLVNRVCDDGQAVTVATELAGAVTANAPLALQVSKQIVRESWTWTEDEWPRAQAPLTREVMTSEDAIEGSRAFAEKREPRWTGR
jgi:enoyl-CoA hydratase